ncbi:MAG: tRNA (adenosine(37)-N6)-threonylcarbamoyltransferase complex ATPase subunit type 1 TsaE [Ruminococcaceae bacterium]|nr:tRNA (adenosine(37)-N6)-threonylcarbamoyltransferase complex ATPase subunit type 1 TsaE [Oscillospiraceae bacterium]
MPSFITGSPEETMALGRRLGNKLKGGELITFTGGLGSGKTTFCRGIAQGLGSQDPVSSPTFAVANLYRGPIPFAHFDAYRIQHADDLETAGFYDYLDSGAVVAVEWSEQVADWLPPAQVRISITAPDAEHRTIMIEGDIAL